MRNVRRKFLVSMGKVAIFAGVGSWARSGRSEDPYSDISATDAWIQQWMQLSAPAVTEPLHLGRFADRMYFLRKKIGWKPNPGQSPAAVSVPKGFVTDFASIPRAFWSLLPPDGQYTYPAIIHDYLYWEQPRSREESDLILRYAMEDFKIDALTIKAIYAGVRAGGQSAWNGNAVLKKAGEKRILTKYPDDPTLKWEDCKRDPNYFEK